MNTPDEFGKAKQAETVCCTEEQASNEEIEGIPPAVKGFGLPVNWKSFEEMEKEENPRSSSLARSTAGDPKSSDRWEARCFQDAMKGSREKPPWIIEDLLPADSATLVSAQPHAMKSLSLLSACLEAMTKKVVWGHFAAPNVGSVLFLETEDPAWMVESRIRGLAKGLGIDEDDPLLGFHYACVGPFDFLSEENRIEELVQKHKPNFIVLSTLQNLLHGRAYNHQEDMQPVMVAMIQLAQLAPLILVTLALG